MRKVLLILPFLLSCVLINTTMGQAGLSPTQKQSLNAFGATLKSTMQGNNVAELIPSVEQYEQLINVYPYRRADERPTHLAKLSNEYSKRRPDLKQNINALNQKANNQGVNISSLQLKDVKFDLKNDLDAIVGGNAIFELKDNNNNMHRLGAKAVYYIDGTWYVLGNLFWL